MPTLSMPIAAPADTLPPTLPDVLDTLQPFRQLRIRVQVVVLALAHGRAVKAA